MYSVIIVDDEKHCIIDIEKSIPWETYGFRIAETYTIPEEAEAGIVAFQPDIVVTDIRMPGVNGMQLLKEVKVRYPRTNVIVMTAYGSVEVKDALERCGRTGYIEKPFEINDLKRDFKNHIDSLRKIIEKDFPPDSLEERERCIADITTLLNMMEIRLNSHLVKF